MIDETLEKMLGATIKDVVYSYIRHQYNLNVETCYKNLEEFVNALREVIGESASIMIENVVVKKLCTSLGLKDANENSSLIDLIEKLKISKYEDSARIEKEV